LRGSLPWLADRAAGDERTKVEAAVNSKAKKDANALAEHVKAIHTLNRQTLNNIIAVGNHLIACKKIVGHRNWMNWLFREFEWSARKATDLMNVARMAKTAKFADLPIKISDAYSLASPSVPPEAVDAIIEKIRLHELKAVEIKQLVASARRNSKTRKGEYISLDRLERCNKTEEQAWAESLSYSAREAIRCASPPPLDRCYPEWQSYAVPSELVSLVQEAAETWTKAAEKWTKLAQVLKEQSSAGLSPRASDKRPRPACRRSTQNMEQVALA
jgi:hypothetical protein